MTKKKPLYLFLLVFILMIILLMFGEIGFDLNYSIISEIRLPKILACFFGGGLLAIAGLLMQLYFQNPLAGPDVLGVTSGSVLMVAIWSFAGFLLPEQVIKLGVGFMSFLGAIIVFLILMYYMKKQNSKVTLIILGILISYFVSSIVTILINSGQVLQIKSYLIWSQGSFRNIVKEELWQFTIFSILSLLPLIYFKKQLNQLSIGENYAQSMGVNIKAIRRVFIFLASIYVSIVTVYCGPISFIGIIAPFLGKKFLRKNSLDVLLPVSFLMGALMAIVVELILISFPNLSLTTNSILGFLGAPVLVYYIYKKQEIVI